MRQSQPHYPRLIFVFAFIFLICTSASASVPLDLKVDQEPVLNGRLINKPALPDDSSFLAFDPVQYTIWPDTGKVRAIYRTSYAMYGPFRYTVIHHDQDGQRIGYQHYELPSRRLKKEAEFTRLDGGEIRISRTVTYDSRERAKVAEYFNYAESGRINRLERIDYQGGVPVNRTVTHYDSFGRKLSETDYQVKTSHEVPARNGWYQAPAVRLARVPLQGSKLVKEIQYRYFDEDANRVEHLIVTGYNRQYEHARTVHLFDRSGRKKGYRQIDLQDGSLQHEIVFA